VETIWKEEIYFSLLSRYSFEGTASDNEKDLRIVSVPVEIRKGNLQETSHICISLLDESAWSYPYTPSYVLMSRRLIEHMDNFNFGTIIHV
jgi:hypothetical protein